ncbi:MAG: S-adenosylmethionine:tRNA ribosyltransferase-isomerase [Candidatus Uhrbacteria bacterium GW2011_GWE2_45_35]|uniref:S-adenosylmethionine:tRNA ribosyltransferase-isomerase n=1 Tax=Candidatus Uhrbacteria bacterium GW2011_GWE2_45_35 TaxID=1618993 RepID=A0A0G1QBI1_9BACT|nr:MAG: S-adenosylmethionine:tRNA ribosyltransferase-isomerase [Candidatus Uhrbacteria bacterium GW2011_GWE2_45_35]
MRPLAFSYEQTFMSTPISLFDYYLPPELIAQEPVEPRDSSRLLVLGGGVKGGKEGLGVVKLEHRKFSDVLNYLRAGDVLIFNDTKVFKARLRGTIREKEIEVFLLSSRSNSSSVTAAVGEVWGGGSVWTSLIKPGRAVQVGDKIIIKNLKAEVLEKKEDGTVLLSFEISSERVIEFANEHGEIPVPPYVKKVPEKLETYQTVYARETGSVAAPTAGFHFTKELLEKIKGQGIKIEFVTLHVGLGTFRPVKSETLEEHEMHSELVEIKSEVAQKINAAKKEGRRIIAVGTTTTRALEGVAALNNGSLPINGFFDEVNIFITPGFKFNIIDGLVTNFHLPKSTLLVLVSTLAGRENILRAYEEAVKEKYRFYSFGDAMLIL